MNDNVNWTRIVQPREQYRILYIDRDNLCGERLIELQKMGDVDGTPYLGVMHAGKFKTLRADRIVGVLEQISKKHEPSVRPQPTYGTDLPKFPSPNAVDRIPTVAVSNRIWKVDFNLNTCTCTEKRIRFGSGYTPGKIGYVCPHMARAILDHLPADAGWPAEVLTFLSDPRKMHMDNLI